MISEKMVQMLYGILEQLRKAPRLKADEVEELAIHTYACQGVGPGAGLGVGPGLGEAKEERETEEAPFPHTPFFEEEKEKEEGKPSQASRTREDFSVHPTLQQVQDYCREIKVDSFAPELFFDHYAARDWHMADGSEIHDWKACVRLWVRQRVNDRTLGSKLRQSAPAPSPATATQPQAKSYSEERDERMAAMEREWARQERESVSYEEYQRMKAEGRIAR